MQKQRGGGRRKKKRQNTHFFQPLEKVCDVYTWTHNKMKMKVFCEGDQFAVRKICLEDIK